MSGFFKNYWWLILGTGAGMLLALRAILQTVKGQYALDKAILKMPVGGLLARKLAVARFARTLSSLLENGASILTALDIGKNIVGNRLIANVVKDAAKEVSQGRPLSMSLASSKLFPDLAIQMIQVGEQSGQMETMLNKITDVFERELEASIMGITSLIEPLMILIMGIAIGFIVFSICLPIFEMNQLVL